MRLCGARALGILLGTASCAGARTPPALAPEITGADWKIARSRLASMRASQKSRPYVVQLRVGMREPRTGKTFEARGALAVDPHAAMRMILVGPAGHTALDVWVTREKWRFVVPGVNFTRTGSNDLASSRGLPINFFRWWFLAPLEGRLLSASTGPEGQTFLLRDATGTVVLRAAPEKGLTHLVLLRREAGAVQSMEWRGKDLTPHAGDHARYVEEGSGLQVNVLVEAVSADEPDPAAFLDPDDPGVAL